MSGTLEGRAARLASSATLVRVALVGVLAMATASRRLFDIGDVTFRGDWLGSAAALLVIALLLLAGRRPPRSAPLVWFTAFVGVHALSAVVNAGTWPRGFRFLVIYCCALAYLLAVLLLVQDRATARFALTALIVIVAAEGAVGVGTLLARNALAMPSGVFNDLGVQYTYNRARAFMSEPNLFASLLLAPFAAALWRWGSERRWAWPQTLLAGALVAALVCALTRIAWLVALVLIAIWARRVGPGRGKLGFVAATAGVTFLVVLATEIPMTGGDLRLGGVYRQTLSPLIKGQDSAVQGRMVELETGFRSFRERPWLGHGPGSSNRLEQRLGQEQILRRRGWIANGTMFVLHDTGVLGLTVLAGTVLATALACRATARRLRDPAPRVDHEALALGLAAVLVAWQSTHGLWQMYGYMQFGLLLALQAVAREEAEVAPTP